MSWFIFAGIAAVLLSLAIIIEKKTLFKERSMEFAVVLAIFIAILSVPLIWGLDLSVIPSLVWGLIYVGSLIGSIGFFLVVRINKHMEVSESSPLLSMAPAFTAIFALAFLRESLTLIQTFGLVLLVVGAFVLESRHGKGILYPFKSFSQLKYGKIIVLSLLLYGLGSVMDRLILHNYGIEPRAYLGIVQMFIALNFLVIAMVFHDGWRGIKHGVQNAGWLILIIAILSVLHRWAYAEAVSQANVGLVAGIKRSSVLFVTIIGGGIFHDHGLMRKTIAVIIMFLGIILLLQ